MLNVENLLKLIATEILINEVYNYFLYKLLYNLPNKNQYNIKQTIGNHIEVEETSVTRSKQ
jgi:hypothetical protein